MYEHLGFFVIAEADLDDVHTWCLLWSNRTFGSEETFSIDEPGD